jgi:hypothetical protein
MTQLGLFQAGGPGVAEMQEVSAAGRDAKIRMEAR